MQPRSESIHEGTRARRSRVWLHAAAMGASLGHATVASAGAGAPPSYGHDLVTVGAPGNRAALESERYYGSAVAGFPNLGQVNYEYRISRTETTVNQWIDFVRVAYPFAEEAGFPRGSSLFAGTHIYSDTPPNQPNAVWHVTPGTNQLATTMSFRFAAWYCNWLHNGRPTTNLTAETFTTGAYDNATLTRQSGAQFWIPSLDEWTKATYYDPNRYGAGQEGYWLYPGMSMVPLVGGPPGSPGAQTSAGNWLPNGQLPPNVGSYPSTMSPWGLLDTSGGRYEWTDTTHPLINSFRFFRGQDLGGGIEMPSDRIDSLFSSGFPDFHGVGFRIASAVPSSGACVPLLVALGCASFGRRRRVMN